MKLTRQYLSTLKTVDELVEDYLDNQDDSDKDDINFALRFILFELNPILLKILNSDTNKPSRFDLMIIYIVNKHLSDSFKYSWMLKILEIYKNRKV